jgi:hypothetical protein
MGGGPEILERLSLAYGEAFDEKTVNKRILNQFSQAGVPLMNALMNDLGLNPENEAQVQQFFKLVHDKNLSFKEVDAAIFHLTHGGGLFEDEMKNFSETFREQMTSFSDMSARAGRDVGDVVNTFTEIFLRFANGSGFWNASHELFGNLKQMAEGVSSFFKTMPTADLIDKVQPIMDKATMAFRKIWDMLGANFTEIRNPATGNIEKVLNATGDDAIKSGIDRIMIVYKRVEEFINGTTSFFQRIEPAISALFKATAWFDNTVYGKVLTFLGHKMTETSGDKANGRVDNAQRALSELGPLYGTGSSQYQAAQRELVDAQQAL